MRSEVLIIYRRNQALSEWHEEECWAEKWEIALVCDLAAFFRRLLSYCFRNHDVLETLSCSFF